MKNIKKWAFPQDSESHKREGQQMKKYQDWGKSDRRLNTSSSHAPEGSRNSPWDHAGSYYKYHCAQCLQFVVKNHAQANSE